MNAYRRARRRRQTRRLLLVACCFALAGVLIAGLVSLLVPQDGGGNGLSELFKPAAEKRVDALREAVVPDWVTPQLIPAEGTARDGTPLSDFRGVVIHYVGNPGTTAVGNRNYFATEGTEVSAHFVVGLEGEVIQCLPLWERSVASNSRNRDTVSIEVCHPDDSGVFSAATYEAVVRLTAWLCEVGGLTEEQVIRHYDITGKECPRYYVKNEDAWEQLKRDITAARTEL